MQLSQVTITHTETADGETTTRSATLEFTYSASGVPLALTCGNTTYLYVTNLQGDVLAILDNTGNPVVEYTYDAWGKLLSTTGSMANTLGGSNPLRYRGYVYDTQTRLYYLQSRYYDPEAGRFLNADALVSTGQGLLGNNMFAYCRGNPVCRVDISGTVDMKADDFDGNPSIDEEDVQGNGSVGGSWSAFLRTLQGALDGLNMAMGQRNLSHTEKHHLFSDKNKKYSPQFEEIAKRNHYSLDHSSNIVPLEGHKGRHTKAYHDFMIVAAHELDAIAAGDPAIFVEGMYHLGEFVGNNPGLPYAKYK